MVWHNINKATGQFIVTAKFKIQPETYRLMKEAQNNNELALCYRIYLHKGRYYARYEDRCHNMISEKDLLQLKIAVQSKLSKLCDQYDSIAHKL